MFRKLIARWESELASTWRAPVPMSQILKQSAVQFYRTFRKA